ncbi:DUF397 domain-containing protein [Actinomadura darangshiensis]|uniref:DUF397 domain-containing protein n=1 Tax=Actinomadura darangshiensis TaxID=705336 RepID=A0A4R5BTB7_9ACTN|nr:DUF397 domain-containing protein [Actinomadura darangshiensis]TDD88876.1 DUF397 domain-containing protein [Actinomadura darangshiensis]
MDLNDLHWRKASRSASNGGECVELAAAPGIIAVRDSKDPDGPKLLMGRDEFAALAAILKH